MFLAAAGSMGRSVGCVSLTCHSAYHDKAVIHSPDFGIRHCFLLACLSETWINLRQSHERWILLYMGSADALVPPSAAEMDIRVPGSGLGSLQPHLMVPTVCYSVLTLPRLYPRPYSLVAVAVIASLQQKRMFYVCASHGLAPPFSLFCFYLQPI